MNKNKRTLIAAGLASLTLVAGLFGPLASTAQAAQTLRVGIMSGEDEDVWRVVAANAAQHGLDIKVTTFSDYTQPNEALSEHDLDANSFQHKPYLDAQVAARHYTIVPVGFTYVQPIGLYSRKYPSVAALPQGATIGVPNDPSNEGRALLLLQGQGLIKLRSDVGLLPTARDIASNPKQIKIKELDAGIVGRAIGDLDAAVVNTDWAIKAGIRIPQERIAQEKVDGSPYRNFIAVNEKDANAPWVKTLVASYQQPNVAAKILAVYHGVTLPAWNGAPQQ
ncbi:MAG: MetQ/NlpA family lipoprotein [Paraburkholderia tropica]|uniref:Lipoprotein n=1 Tax=Paraburkholderia tropica TaxID=92647 RepID=A0ABX5MG38_9BURK|nr:MULTISPECIES: MetQ/NlpA family lipoprotein [Paraburkholderia]MBB3001366.1 D-methionine transport system substrate-binding protein [Paraburkholderia tropica]MBB6323358.1 D-methionine transport system substrate-binding protein [Paraburkholderia tropica]MDE1140862.1 MetQ/NlpA family lipoprotein [Paraburkholderia tropica]PXX09556.1 D-methionine transport system substrate-binding protein [Paraburkholderia tropica]PZW74616.1 D-methionine transport system substrate-binding protein [Paraburkholderi